MRKYLLVISLIGILTVAYFTKPDDKTCIIAAVKAVWGDRTPDEKKSIMYNKFMDLTSKQVIIDDWIFVKRIRYRFPKKEYNIGIGVFNQIITNE